MLSSLETNCDYEPGFHVEAIVEDRTFSELEGNLLVDAPELLSSVDAEHWTIPPTEAETTPVINGRERLSMSRICERQARCALAMARVTFI